MGKRVKSVRRGDVVLLEGGRIGTVKWLGKLPNAEADSEQYIGIVVAEGSGDGDGTYQGVRLFACETGKGVITLLSAVKSVVTAEKLLTKIVWLNQTVKDNDSKINQLKDELTLVKNEAATFKFNAQDGEKKGNNDDSDDGIKSFLKNEITKKWWISVDDLCARYKTRPKPEVESIYKGFKEFDFFRPTQPHSRIVYTVCASPRDNLIGSGSDDKTIRLWRKDLTQQHNVRCIATLQLRSCINSLAFSPTGEMLAAALDSGWIELYNLHTGKMVGALEGQTTSEVWTICFSPDGNNVISGALDRAVRIWDVKDRECRWALRGHDEWVNGVAVSSDGTTIVSGSGDKTVRIWDTKRMQCRQTLRGHTDFVRSVCVTQDGNSVVSASDDCQLRVWDMKGGQCKNVLQGHTKGIYSVAAGAGNNVASASRDSTVKVWDITSKKFLKEFKGHRGDVNSCCFVDDGRYVASGSDDKMVMCFDIRRE